MRLRKPQHAPEGAGLVASRFVKTACGVDEVDWLFLVSIPSAVRDFDEMARFGPS